MTVKMEAILFVVSSMLSLSVHRYFLSRDSTGVLCVVSGCVPSTYSLTETSA